MPLRTRTNKEKRARAARARERYDGGAGHSFASEPESARSQRERERDEGSSLSLPRLVALRSPVASSPARASLKPGLGFATWVCRGQYGRVLGFANGGSLSFPPAIALSLTPRAPPSTRALVTADTNVENWIGNKGTCSPFYLHTHNVINPSWHGV